MVSLQSLDLPELISLIKEQHTRRVKHTKLALHHAKAAGDALLEAKRRIAHGEWLTWLSANFVFGRATASTYMAIAGHWAQLADDAEGLSIRGAKTLLKLIENPPAQERDSRYPIREELLQQLESVQPLRPAFLFVFRDGQVTSHHQDVVASRPCNLKLTGAVPAEPFLRVLGRADAPDHVLISQRQNFIRLWHFSRLRLITLQELELTQPARPKNWSPLPADFALALSSVLPCIDIMADPTLTHVYLTPDWVEACSDKHLARYQFNTGLKRSALLNAEVMRHVAKHEPNEVSEQRHWVFFRNAAGLVVSVRRYEATYPDLNKVLSLPVSPLKLSKPLETTSAKQFAPVHVTLHLESGRILLSAENISGHFSIRRKCDYNGERKQFRVLPDLLADVLKDGSCEVGDHLKSTSGPLTYIVRTESERT